MGTVEYTIVSGAAPFTAELIPSLIPINNHNVVGTYSFIDVPDGGYALIITDSNGCTFQQEITVDPLIATTTTTIIEENSIVVGNTQDESLIFSIQGTNRDSHYDGYPNPNTLILYLWFKTLNGAPLTEQKIINYSFTSVNESTFLFNELSDQMHAEVIQIIPGIASAISGQIILKVGFIETYFKYVYVKNPIIPYSW